MFIEAMSFFDEQLKLVESGKKGQKSSQL